MSTADRNWNFVKPIFRPVMVSDGIAHQEGIYYNQIDDKIQFYSINLTGSADTLSSYAGEVKLFCALLQPEQPRTIASELAAFQQTISGLPSFADKLGHNLDDTIEHIKRLRKESGLDQFLHQTAGLPPKSLRQPVSYRDTVIEPGELIIDLNFLGLARLTSQTDNVGEQIQQMVDSLGSGELAEGLRQVFPEFSEATQSVYQHYGFHFAVDPTVDDGHRHRYRLGGNGHVSMNIPSDTNLGAEVNLSLDNAQARPILPSPTSQGFSTVIAASSNNCFLHIANNSGLSCSYTLDITRLGESFLVGDAAETEE